jgi:triosephosphate isomerase
LIPFICVGETEQTDTKTATTYCIAETFSALAEVPNSVNPFVVLYEPIWAIGAAGVDMGRNIFQRENPTAMVQAVRGVVHDELDPAQALQLYRDLSGGAED